MANFNEYTRIRDIVQKRMKRAVAAGLMEPVHFPTVKEIKSGLVTPKEALQAVKDYFSSGSQVKTIRQTGLVPMIKSFPTLPPEPKKTSADRKERRREYQREYRRRKKVREIAITPEKGKKYEAYLKALETVGRTWKKAGMDIGIDLRKLSPSEAQAFVEYMDYRFSQGDFTQRYVIDEFIQDFSRLLKKGHSAKNIIKDYEGFLENRYNMNARRESMEGLSNAETMQTWSDMANRNGV